MEISGDMVFLLSKAVEKDIENLISPGGAIKIFDLKDVKEGIMQSHRRIEALKCFFLLD